MSPTTASRLLARLTVTVRTSGSGTPAYVNLVSEQTDFLGFFFYEGLCVWAWEICVWRLKRPSFGKTESLTVFWLYIPVKIFLKTQTQSEMQATDKNTVFSGVYVAPAYESHQSKKCLITWNPAHGNCFTGCSEEKQEQTFTSVWLLNVKPDYVTRWLILEVLIFKSL